MQKYRTYRLIASFIILSIIALYLVSVGSPGGRLVKERQSEKTWSEMEREQGIGIQKSVDINLAEKKRIIEFRVRNEPAIAVLVMACNRVTVTRCLDKLLKFRPSPQEFPIIVSQDCDDRATDSAIRVYGDKVFRIKQPDQSRIYVKKKENNLLGYYKIARHYGWALNQTFFTLNFSTVIIVEDDLDISPDVFEYFKGTLPLLYADPTLWCVSAFNDNGKSGLVETESPHLLHRTDFFPGLGWMLTKSKWLELYATWPASYWDDWFRKPDQRKGRSFIRPEISRTKTFGKDGVSEGIYYENHLKHIHLNDRFVPFTKLNLSYLLKGKYDEEFEKAVQDSPVVSYQELKTNARIITNGSVKVPYYDKDTYKIVAVTMGLMDDLRSGIPRTAYRGVVSFYYNNRRVYIAPNPNWKGYNLSWT